LLKAFALSILINYTIFLPKCNKKITRRRRDRRGWFVLLLQFPAKKQEKADKKNKDDKTMLYSDRPLSGEDFHQIHNIIFFVN
jgi:hypothetical protein